MEEVILLADPNSKAWSFAQRIQKYLKQEKEVDINLLELELKKFRNEEIGMHVPENLRQKDVYFIQDTAKNPQDWWVELLLISDLVLNASAKSLSFVLPDMMYSRQDRKDKHHVPISSRALAASISPGVKRIITMDLHAAQIQGFYPKSVPVDNLYSFPEVVRYLRSKHMHDLQNLVVVSPDVGGADRAKAFLGRLEKAQEKDLVKNELHFALISKTRTRPGEVDHMELVGNVGGKNVILIDDIIDSGGTLCKAAELLKQNGAQKLFCYATHGIFTKGTDVLCSCYNSVMCSNTHDIKQNGIEVIDVTNVFAEAIYRAQKGLSISKLFKIN